ncbi:tRNA (adenine(22)-N(1))-methyltransferase TrmK [Lactobacillaceae bacterium 24-114]
MDAQHLSKRLATVAKYVPKEARIADIGSDHAYLPAALALNNQITYAIAGEVVQGPYENAKHEIENLNLMDIIHPRLKDGLAAIDEDDQIDTITIAGMGGALITKILDAHPEKLVGVKRLILQPNIGESRLRRWLMDHRYQIMAEEIVAEDGHTYEIIVAEFSPVPFRYNERELDFGPFLLEKQSSVFKKKWANEYERQKKILQQMKAAKVRPEDRIKKQQIYLNHIKGVL